MFAGAGRISSWKLRDHECGTHITVKNRKRSELEIGTAAYRSTGEFNKKKRLHFLSIPSESKYYHINLM